MDLLNGLLIRWGLRDILYVCKNEHFIVCYNGNGKMKTFKSQGKR